jgi:diguanylate cyclase (GGDEF)-like protein
MSDQGEDQFEKTAILKGDSETLKVEREKAKAANACLILIRGTPQGKRFEIVKDSMFIGRDITAEISITDNNISRKHAEIKKLPDGAVGVRDNQSTNGTFVNEKKIGTDPVPLKKEDMIKLGNTILKYLPAGELEIYFYGSLEDAAHTDALTKVYNKGYIMEALEAEFKRARALHHDFSLVIIDLDHFKKINDTHGHDAGDMVLKDACKLIREKLIPKSGIFGRFGGEEFMLLLPNMGIDAAEKVAENLRASLEGHAFVYEGKKLPVTASLGVAVLAADIDSSNGLFKLADKAVYASKSGGRNRVSRAT